MNVQKPKKGCKKMSDCRRSQELVCWKRIFMLVLWCFAASSVWPQTHSPRAAQSANSICTSPNSQIPANPLLVNHSNFFCTGKVYDLKNDPPYNASFPSAVNYKVYSAVGYDLANTMMLAGPQGVVIIDTLSEETSAKTAIEQFKKILNLDATKPLPVKA